MGVWIETEGTRLLDMGRSVTPCMGVWIETEIKHIIMYDFRVTPCMGVWIETSNTSSCCQTSLSHPVWVCGLKLDGIKLANIGWLSHPVWVCGLKH